MDDKLKYNFSFQLYQSNKVLYLIYPFYLTDNIHTFVSRFLLLPRGIVATFISGFGLGICSILDLITSTDWGAAAGTGTEAGACAGPGADADTGGAVAASFGITGTVGGGGGGGGTEAVFGSATEAAPTGPDVETGVDKTAGSLLCTEGWSALAKKLTQKML